MVKTRKSMSYDPGRPRPCMYINLQRSHFRIPIILISGLLCSTGQPPCPGVATESTKPLPAPASRHSTSVPCSCSSEGAPVEAPDASAHARRLPETHTSHSLQPKALLNRSAGLERQCGLAESCLPGSKWLEKAWQRRKVCVIAHPISQPLRIFVTIEPVAQRGHGGLRNRKDPWQRRS